MQVGRFEPFSLVLIVLLLCFSIPPQHIFIPNLLHPPLKKTLIPLSWDVSGRLPQLKSPSPPVVKPQIITTTEATPSAKLCPDTVI